MCVCGIYIIYNLFCLLFKHAFAILDYKPCKTVDTGKGGGERNKKTSLG